MEHDDWDDALSDLLAGNNAGQHQPQHPEPNDDWSEMLQGLVDESRHNAAAVDSVDVVAVDNGTAIQSAWFGPTSILSRIGTPLQLTIFNAFVYFAARGAEHDKVRSEQISDIVDQYMVSGTIVSTRALSEKTATPPSTLKRRLGELACVVVNGAAWIIGALLAVWCTLFRSGGGYAPIAAFSMMKYDETPLKLKIIEFQTYFGEDPQMVKLSKEGESYTHAKILRVEWRYGALAS